MNSDSKIIGLIQARDEWPLLALSISHALIHHIEEVCVMNNASVDGSLAGLQRLRQFWGDRIHVFDCQDEYFWQEAQINALIVVSQDFSPDWIYVFDADEFLLTQGNRPLKEILEEIGPEHTAVSYDVQNWISLEDFEEACLDNYRKLLFRSVPNVPADMHPDERREKIWSGTLSFFDMPFPRKVIFRNNADSWLAAGAHFLKHLPKANTFYASADLVRSAHFPYLVRTRLERKARQGQRHILNGMPTSHGWQNQLIFKYSQENKLGLFWKNHTFANDSKRGRSIRYLIDHGFVEAIEPALRLLENELDPGIFQRTGGENLPQCLREDTQIPFRCTIQATRKFQLIADSLTAERDAKVAERDAKIAERDAKIAERDAKIAEIDKNFNNYKTRNRKQRKWLITTLIIVFVFLIFSIVMGRHDWVTKLFWRL